MTTRKVNQSKSTNGNGKQPVKRDLDDVQSSFWRTQNVLNTVYKALEAAEESDDSDGVTRAINTLRIGLDMLRSADEELDRFSFRLFHEGCPPEDVKKILRESTPPAVHILRSSRTPVQKVKALQKVMRVSAS